MSSSWQGGPTQSTMRAGSLNSSGSGSGLKPKNRTSAPALRAAIAVYSAAPPGVVSGWPSARSVSTEAPPMMRMSAPRSIAGLRFSIPRPPATAMRKPS